MKIKSVVHINTNNINEIWKYNQRLSKVLIMILQLFCLMIHSNCLVIPNQRCMLFTCGYNILILVNSVPKEEPIIKCIYCIYIHRYVFARLHVKKAIKKITVFSKVAHEKAFIYPNVSKMQTKYWKNHSFL